METAYITQLDSKGTPIMLFRFRGGDNESSEEYLEGDVWVQDNSLISVLRDLHNPQYKGIKETEATEIAKQLGGSIHD